MMHEQEKSDLFIVATKPANKPGQPGAESVERREGAKGNAGQLHTCRTQRRVSVSQRLNRIRQAAISHCRHTQGGSRVRELRPLGSVRGARSNPRPYREVDRRAATPSRYARSAQPHGLHNK